jgi:hypothetical protein
MNLGRLCQYAGDCPIYNDKNPRIDKPIFLIRNVFCNRGRKGWENCKRFELMQKRIPFDENIMPTD